MFLTTIQNDCDFGGMYLSSSQVSNEKKEPPREQIENNPLVNRFQK